MSALSSSVHTCSELISVKELQTMFLHVRDMICTSACVVHAAAGASLPNGLQLQLSTERKLKRQDPKVP